ncbi:MAG: Rieske (2Fe-2S) protein [Chloroflexi bacterium]|nr:Rieske (2Fe-2S) protein [Chloroflexota bacterium]
METTQTAKPITRRDFVKLSWGALASLVSLEVGGLALAYMQPRLAEGEFGSLITAGLVDDFPPGSVTHIPAGRFYLSRLADGGFLAIYQRCTHLGCNVPWDQEANAFVCPCHNSQFTVEGALVSPPAPRPLDLFPITIEAGEIRVDTGKPLTRQAYDPSQVVYP